MTEKDINIEDEETLEENPVEETDNQAEEAEKAENAEKAEASEEQDPLEKALAACAPEEEVFVIGGASVYAEALPYADKLQLTLVHDTPAVADVFFPPLDPDEWKVTAEECHDADERHAFEYTFVDYERLAVRG